jgi:hypothetical protein
MAHALHLDKMMLIGQMLEVEMWDDAAENREYNA